MSSPLPAMPSRDGVTTLRQLARAVCVLVSTFGPLIERKYEDNEAIIDALNWARTACTIVPALDDALTPGGNNSEPVSDPTTIPGVRPSAPAPTPVPEE